MSCVWNIVTILWFTLVNYLLYGTPAVLCQFLQTFPHNCITCIIHRCNPSVTFNASQEQPEHQLTLQHGGFAAFRALFIFRVRRRRKTQTENNYLGKSVKLIYHARLWSTISSNIRRFHCQHSLVGRIFTPKSNMILCVCYDEDSIQVSENNNIRESQKCC